MTMVFLDDTQLVDLARKTLEIDEKPSSPLPAFYRRAFDRHAARFPNDTNFIVEFARPDKKGSPTGGNGFGIATCLEDYCWTDVRLGADPSLPDGGKGHGFGSLWEYEVHCEKADHVRGRDERCQKAGVTYQPTEAATRQNSQAKRSQPSSDRNAAAPPRSSLSPVLPSDAELASWMSGSPYRITQPKASSKASESSRSISSNAVAGPSRHTPLFSTPSWTKAMEGSGSSQSSSHRGSQILQPSDRHNHPSGSLASQLDIKPKITSPNTSLRPHHSSIIDLLDDSDSDNEVSVLRDDQIPSDLRKKSNKSNPYILSDDEDDGKSRPSQGSSSSAVDRVLGKPRALVGRSSQGGVNVFEQMMNERYPPVPHRSQGVKPVIPKAEQQPKQEQAPTTAVKSEPNGGRPLTFGPNASAGPSTAPIASASGGQVPGAYPLNAIAGPSRSLYNMPIQPQAQNAQAEATRSRLETALALVKQGRDVQLRREYDAAMGLKREAIVARVLLFQRLSKKETATGQGLSNQDHRDLLAYSHSILALVTQPATMPFPVLPASIAQRWPWFSTISQVSAQKHQQYRDSHVAVQASNAMAAVIGAGDIKPDIGGPLIPGLATTGSIGPYAGLAARNGMTEEEFGDMFPEYYREADRPTNLQEFFAGALHDFSEDQDIDKALQTLGLTDVNQRFADMTVTLMPHQILGVAFMLEKEKDRKFRGGLLCDAMGLGKTVQAIATIAGHPSEDRRVKTTLIIAPLAVLQQWKSEIESKTADGLLKIHVHHGATRAKSSNILKNADIVLTTYGTMVADFAAPKKKKKTGRAANSDDEEEDDVPEIPRKKGPIFRIRWYRVILDEAHFIRNKNTQASKAVWDLDSVYRWSLTGTLINNSLDDVFPHLRFLDISPQSDWSEWRKHIAARAKKAPRLAANRTQAILKTCMMRRHKESLLNGQRLLNLPPKETRIMELDFTEEEREIYNQVEQRMKIKFGKFLKQGTVLKHLSCVLTMLMRLRQLTCHPWLLRRNPGDPAHPDDFQVSDEDLYNSLNIPIANAGADFMNAINIMGEDWVADMAKRLRERYDRMLNATKKDEETEKDNECSICLDIYTDEIVTECKHSFCRGCIDEIFQNAPRDGGDLTDEQAASGARKCPMCRAVIERKKVFAAVAFFDPEKEKDEKPDISEAEGSDRKGKRKSTGEDDDEFQDIKPDVKKLNKGKGKAKAEADEEDVKPEEGLDRIESVLPSTKMKVLGQLIDEYLAEPDIKVIVFSEFVSYLELCGIFLGQKDIPYRTYHGGMRTKDREDVVREFSAPVRDERSPRVMLISRKAGGAGLNLTAASKVISLDLAWNAAAENQSVDRAHRIGQTRPVDIRRLVIQNTVEQRILELQERKSALADGAMGEGTGGRLGRLSVQDLMRLFDYNHEDI